MKLSYLIALCVFALPAASASAQGSSSGTITTLQSYQGHTGTLVRLSVPMANPDNCSSVSWYILPDDGSRASLEQSMLLTAYSRRDSVMLNVQGCYQNYPQIRVITIEAK